MNYHGYSKLHIENCRRWNDTGSGQSISQIDYANSKRDNLVIKWDLIAKEQSSLLTFLSDIHESKQ